MARRRVGFSVDEYAFELLRAAAARAGMSLSSWLADAAVQEAVRQGAPPESGGCEADAIEADAEHAAVEAELHAAG